MSEKKQYLDTPGLTRHTNNMFEYIDKKIPTSLPANGGNSDTVNGHNVEIDVPSDAVFTDTTYENATPTSSGLMSADDKLKMDLCLVGKIVDALPETPEDNLLYVITS